MNKIVKDALILTAITIISGALLGVVYEVTKGPIAAVELETKNNAYKEVFADASEFTDLDVSDATEGLGDYADVATIDGVVTASDGSNDLGYVITVTDSEGYGGDIQMTVGIQNDGTVNGISFLSISETAGLGMRAKESSFMEQFAGKQVESFSYVKDGTGSQSDETIDALSGATITSNAVTNGVDAAISYFTNVLGGGSANE
jgi:electron transport complex protein RnfG